jgi:hypothetical protein
MKQHRELWQLIEKRRMVRSLLARQPCHNWGKRSHAVLKESTMYEKL